MGNLFDLFKLRNVEFRNRIAVSPMCEYSSEDGFANDWHLVHLGSRAVGGAGLVFTEAAAVSPEGRISANDLGIWKDGHIEQLRRITEFIHSQGAVAGIQLAHAGRKASVHAPWLGGGPLNHTEGAWQTVAPSPIAFRDGEPVPLELDKSGIQKVLSDFRDATRRALEAGFKVVEIHAAHGYLLNQFLSPASNKRRDEYGGSFENRSRLLLQVIDTVRSEWLDDYPLFVRISAVDWTPDGWNIDDSVRLARVLKDKSVDLIDCSSGGNAPGVKIPVGPLYQVPFAAEIKKQAGIKVGAVGLITTAEEADQIIAEDKADMIFLAREFLRDPYFPLHAAKKLNADVKWPVQYERAKK